MKGFKEFIMQGNLLELAVAVVIGAAFGEVVKSLSTMLMDIVGLAFKVPTFSTFVPYGVHVGAFITAFISFLLVALVIYFAVVKPVTALRNRLNGANEEAALTTEDLLVQIRDLLAARR